MSMTSFLHLCTPPSRQAHHLAGLGFQLEYQFPTLHDGHEREPGLA